MDLCIGGLELSRSKEAMIVVRRARSWSVRLTVHGIWQQVIYPTRLFLDFYCARNDSWQGT